MATPATHESRSTHADLANLDDDALRRLRRSRRLGYAVTTAALTALMAAAVLDGVDVVDAFGVDDDHVVAEADGLTLDVRYPTVSRPALASPFHITIRQDGGFDGQQIEIAVSTEYLSLWDLNGIFPAPAEETADGDRVLWTFDVPDGEVLEITYDARIEPAVQSGERGRVAVLDDQGDEQVAVSFETRVRP